MIADIFVALVVAAAPAGGGPGAPNQGTPEVRPMPLRVGGGNAQPGATVSQSAQEPEILAAETALRDAEMRAREAQIEVSRRVSEVQEARMGVDLARSEVDLRKLKLTAKTADEKSRVKAIESRVSVLRALISDDLPAMRKLQSQMLKAQMEDPAAVAPVQVELMTRQRTIARKQVELEIATMRAGGGDPARIQAMERRLEELKKQSPAVPPVGGSPKPGAKTKGKT